MYTWEFKYKHILCDQNDVNFVITLPKGTSYMYIQIFNRVFSWNFYLLSHHHQTQTDWSTVIDYEKQTLEFYQWIDIIIDCVLCRSFDLLMLYCCRNMEPRSTLKMILSMKWPWKRRNFRRFPPILRQVLYLGSRPCVLILWVILSVYLTFRILLLD